MAGTAHDLSPTSLGSSVPPTDVTLPATRDQLAPAAGPCGATGGCDFGEGADATIDAPPEPTQPANANEVSHDRTRGARVRYFGDYEVQKELGRGGMGVVYQARQVSLNRPVALKMIKAGVLADEAELRRFQNEAEAVALLDHPGIVPVYEVGDHDGQRYFSMKLVEGGNLADRLDDFKDDPRAAADPHGRGGRGGAPRPHAWAFFTATSSRPTSCVDAEGHPHVTDFGLAKRVEDDAGMTLSGAILGTPSYMAPEQAAGRAGIDHDGDRRLWPRRRALCPAGEPAAVRRRQRGGHSDDGPRAACPSRRASSTLRVPRDLETICLKCLEKDPRRRYSSAQAFADDLRRWLDDRPISARPVGSIERLGSGRGAGRPWRRRCGGVCAGGHRRDGGRDRGAGPGQPTARPEE